MSGTRLLFIYVTLKRGFCRANFLSGQQFLGVARSQPKYRMFDCGTYPGLKPFPGDGMSIRGEMWAVDAECLTRLDREEGVHEGLYARAPIEIVPELSSSVDVSHVEAYFYLPSVTGFPDCGESWV